MTLHERIQHYYLKDTYRFKSKHVNRMGVRLLNLWKVLNPDAPPLPLVKSIEENGRFDVLNYPDEFVNIIDQVIRNYHQEQLEIYRRQRRKEAAEAQVPSQSPTTPINKQPRKRIPINKVPVWKSR